MAEVVADKTHALLSPSGAHRWTRCPGSVVLEQQVENKSSPHARWGTCCHEVGAMILQSAVMFDPFAADGAAPLWQPQDAESFIGRTFQIDGFDLEFDHEMADCVNDYVAHVETFWSPGDVLLVEQSVPLEQITGEKGAEGTSDCIIIHGSEIVVIDLKGGRGVQVFAEDNEQGVMYAAGAAHEHGPLYGPFDTVRIVIIQPRLQHVDECKLSWEHFEACVAAIKAAAKQVGAARGDEPSKGGSNDYGRELYPEQWASLYLNPGEKQCKFCNAKSFCPALEGAVSDALSLTVEPARAEEFPDLSLAKQASAAVPSGLGAVERDRLAKAWKAIPLVEQWVDAVRSMTHELLHDGQPVGDLCLYEGKQGARAWSDETKAEELLKKARIKADEMYTKKLLTYPAAEKAFKGKTVWAKLAPLVDRPDGKPVVGVQGDAKRTPWSPARPEDFPDLDADELFS